MANTMRPVAWRVSTRSASGSGNCVEAGVILANGEQPDVAWRISTRSANGSANCVEAGPFLDGSARVAVRNSRYRDDATLVFGTEAWVSFVDTVRAMR